MAELLTVKDDLTEQGWRSGAVLVKDEGTGEHYVVSTINVPWNDRPETLVYVSDENGDVPDHHAHVAGGFGQSQEDAFADLSARIDEGRLLTPDEAEDVAEREMEADYERFIEWLSGGGDLGAALEEAASR